MDSFKKFSETKLPTNNDHHITDEDYKYAKRVWKGFGQEYV